MHFSKIASLALYAAVASAAAIPSSQSGRLVARGDPYEFDFLQASARRPMGAHKDKRETDEDESIAKVYRRGTDEDESVTKVYRRGIDEDDSVTKVYRKSTEEDDSITKVY